MCSPPQGTAPDCRRGCRRSVPRARSGIDLLVTDAAVRDRAEALLPFVVLVPLVGTPAWLLDGVFIGAIGGRALRNAAILSTAFYIATDLALRPFGAAGVWIALLASYAYRALALGWRWPWLLRSVG
ncbi:hypothetical protein [Sphingomonas sp. DT-204]|uniref:hypothetical protein n=1 Tax=Sphingomonas sp. DT-204 TaxID=3396166 RepID=UPI003F1A6EF8